MDPDSHTRDRSVALIRPVVETLVTALGQRARSPGMVAEQICVDGAALARFVDGNDDPRTDVAMAVARASGGVLVPLPMSMQIPLFRGTPQLYVDPTQVAGDLLRLRRIFASWREGLGLSASGLAAACGIVPSSVIASERGGIVPLLSSSERHARRFGMTLRVVEARELERAIVKMDQFRRRQTPFLRDQMEAARRRAPKWRVKEAAVSAADVVSAMLFDTAAAAGIAPDDLALRAGVDRRTIVRPDSALQPLGRVSVAAKIAAALDMDIVVAPSAVAPEIERIASMSRARPAVRTLGEVRSEARRQVSAMSGSLVALERRCAQKKSLAAARLAAGTARVASDMQIDAFAERCERLGLTLLAVPADAAPSAALAASKVQVAVPQPAPRRRTDIALRNGRLRDRFMKALHRMAGRSELPREKSSLQAVLDFCSDRGLAIEVVDDDGSLAGSQAGGSAGDLFRRLMVLRGAKGVSLKAVSSGVGLTPPAVRRMERRPQEVLLTSALRYADALGLTLVPVRSGAEPASEAA